MFRMSKASIIRSSICTEQVGRYNVRVIVGSSYGVCSALRISSGLACGGYGSAVGSVASVECPVFNKTPAELHHAGFIY